MNKTSLATPLLSSEKKDYCHMIKSINENQTNYKQYLITLTDIGMNFFIKDFRKK